jgi:hypothetical protein
MHPPRAERTVAISGTGPYLTLAILTPGSLMDSNAGIGRLPEAFVHGPHRAYDSLADERYLVLQKRLWLRPVPPMRAGLRWLKLEEELGNPSLFCLCQWHVCRGRGTVLFDYINGAQ